MLRAAAFRYIVAYRLLFVEHLLLVYIKTNISNHILWVKKNIPTNQRDRFAY